MFYIADLHVHSHYSRATSKDLNLESLYQWARIKGINIVGTGDFTHPLWFKELQEKLEPDGHGFFKLKDPPKVPAMPGLKCRDIDVRFCLTSEISSIYKKGDKVRKNHNLLYAPDFDTVAKINARLGAIGNLESDGRPILGLPSRDLLEVALEASDRAYLVPAHVWTPWFSTLGSKSGYDSIDECFEDLTEHIFALETGLSSDPEMNWRLSGLDRFTMISNSDAHSPQKLGREANLFDTELSYDGMFNAIRNRQGFLGTYEFFPEEGKYHMDGHRKCGVRLYPEDTLQYKGVCPECGKPLTVGVLHRVVKLADRKMPERPEGAADFHYIIPLPEIISEIKTVGPGSKAVQQTFQQIISAFGNEFSFLREVPIEDIRRQFGPVVSEAIHRMRENRVNPNAGFDGEYGVIRIFNEGELKALTGQLNFFGAEKKQKTEKRVSKEMEIDPLLLVEEDTGDYRSMVLNEAQVAVQQAEGAVLVKAGPGTGKTRTLTHWIVNCIDRKRALPEQIMAVTFTNKAADELQERLAALLGDRLRGMRIGTFHSICYTMLQERYPHLDAVYDDESRLVVLRLLFTDYDIAKIRKLAKALVRYFELGENIDYDGIAQCASTYRQYLETHSAVDLADIIGQVVRLLEHEPAWLQRFRDRYHYLAVDEFQDINALQYRFLSLLGKERNVLVIGDPDQAIYGFRGSDVQFFFQFGKAFKVHEIGLEENYRSTANILGAAGALIRNNAVKSGLKLKSNRPAGNKIKLFTAEDSMAEARYIVSEIDKYVGGFSNLTMDTASYHSESDYAFSDIAVLFRTRTVGKELFLHFKKAGIPAHYGDGTSFLAAPPFSIIADILRLYMNAKDMIAMHGLLTHGLGWEDKMIGLLLKNMPEIGDMPNEDQLVGLSDAAKQSFAEWRSFYLSLSDTFQQNGVEGAVRAIMKCYLPDSRLDAGQILKKEAILALACESQADMQDFLEKMTLNAYTDVGRLKADGVHLLTFHAAKGLEFPVVFIAGAEEGITPLSRQGTEIEEERRLFYVALTRAMDDVQITCTKQRRQFKELKKMQPSRFLAEVPLHLMERVEQRENPRTTAPAEDQLSLF